jgi:hypothetical protein
MQSRPDGAERQQLCSRVRITCLDGVNDIGDFAHARHTGYIESRQVLDDFRGHKHTWAELRGAGHTVVNPKMSILATDDLQGRHPIERPPVFGNLAGKLPGVSPVREAGRNDL